MKRMPFPVVAVVGDDLDDRLLLKKAFEDCRPDLEIHLFTNGEDLLDYLNQSGKDSQEGITSRLIVLDLHLSGEKGFDLIKEIKTNPDLRRIPIIVLTGSSSNMETKQYYDLGANTVITRPASFDELVRALKVLCDYWFGPVRM